MRKTEVIVHIFDDITPDVPADETITIALDGVTYEVDLSTTHAKELRERVAPFIDVARRLPRPRTATGLSHQSKSVRKQRQERAEIRLWGLRNGYQVSSRGKLPAALVDAYRAAR